MPLAQSARFSQAARPGDWRAALVPLHSSCISDGLGISSPVATSLPRHERLGIGLLLSRSNVYPALHSQFAAGMDLWLTQRGDVIAGRRVELVPGDAGFGPAVAQEAARKRTVYL